MKTRTLDIGKYQIRISYHPRWENDPLFDNPYFVQFEVWAKRPRAKKYRYCSVEHDGRLSSLYGYHFSFEYPPDDLYARIWPVYNCTIFPVPQERWQEALEVAEARKLELHRRLHARKRRDAELELLEPGSKERIDLAFQPL